MEIIFVSSDKCATPLHSTRMAHKHITHVHTRRRPISAPILTSTRARLRRDKGQYDEYLAEMPWLALPFENRCAIPCASARVE